LYDGGSGLFSVWSLGLSHCSIKDVTIGPARCNNFCSQLSRHLLPHRPRRPVAVRCRRGRRPCCSPNRITFPAPIGIFVASTQELSDFLRSVERRAFKRALFHVRDDEAALDIVQDSMMKLAEHYADKPVAELPMLFQRILSNCMLDWFRRQKTRNALFTNMGEFESATEDGDFDLLESLALADDPRAESSEASLDRAQVLSAIEQALQGLPARQREAFLLRYWEELDVAETAAVMGCSEGSVKTHCSRAVQALSKALKVKGIHP
jgi:RNA polymerase sigma-70 factor (ECF subfamily)